MASVTFPPSIGGDGSTVSDDSNVSTGLANGGHRTRFVPALAQLVQIAGFLVPLGQNATNAPGTSATSTSSITIAIGSRSLILGQLGKAFAVGQWVQVTNLASPRANYMMGAITAFDASTGAMTVDVAQIAGSGTATSWAVHPASPIGNEFQIIGANGSLALTGSGTVGYGVGAGGSVTQVGSKSAIVELNKPSGRIIMHNASLAAGATVQFGFNNSTIGADDVVIVNIVASFTAQAYDLRVEGTGAGGCVMILTNRSGGPLADALQLRFVVFKGAIS